MVSPDFAVTGSICREGRKPGQLSSPTALVSRTGGDDVGNGVNGDCHFCVGNDIDNTLIDRSEMDAGGWLSPTLATIGFRSVESKLETELKVFLESLASFGFEIKSK